MCKTLASFLSSIGYTEDEVDETLLRLDCGMELPYEVKKDIERFVRQECEALRRI